MKILHVVHCYPPEPVGGTERVAASLVQSLSQRGHDLHVIAGSLDWKGGFRVERNIHQGIPVTRIHRNDPWFDRWDNGYHPEVERIYQELLDELQPDLVHIHHWIRLTRNLVQLTRAKGIPTVVQLHDFHATCPHTFRLTQENIFCYKPGAVNNCINCVKRWPFQEEGEIKNHLEHFFRDMKNELRCAHRVLALSQSQARRMQYVLPTLDRKIKILPPGPITKLKPKNSHTTSHALRILHWGNLYDLKGVMHLVEAVALAEKRTPIELNILGKAIHPDFNKALRERIKGLPIRLFGAFEKQELENMEADLAVFPSLCFETYSLVVDEALMLGLPVIVSNLGAPAERVNGSGFAVPPGNVQALADQLVRLAEDRDELKRLKAGVSYNGLSKQEVAARAEQIYQDVLKAGSAPLPEDPITDQERLNLFCFTAGRRLLSLVGANVKNPPLS